ncbi:MAG: hypothetical protein K9J13_08780 [Saprospiraceae bacterium]|nr:hypothetical protein [Saprospiraceae bacterium]
MNKLPLVLSNNPFIMRFVISIIFSLLFINSFSQVSISIGPYSTEPAKNIGIILGHQGFKQNLEEIGVAFNFVESRRKKFNPNRNFSPFNYTKPFFGMSGSMLYDFDDGQISGGKASAWFQFFICAGLEYSNFVLDNKNYNLVNGKIGLELFGFAFTFDKYLNSKYNNNAFPDYFFSLRYYIPIKYFR